MLADQLELGLGRGLGEEVVDAGLGGDGRRGEAVVAGDHHGLDAHAAQLGEALLDAALDDVLQLDDAEHARAVGHHQRRAAAARDVVDRGLQRGREAAAQRLDMAADRVGRALAHLRAPRAAGRRRSCASAP